MQNKIATFGIFTTVREILAEFYDVDVDFELSHTQLCAKINDRVQSSLGRNIFRIQENGDGGVVTELSYRMPTRAGVEFVLFC